MGKQVLLTLIHRRIPDRSTTLGVSAGWHAHLDVLVARASGTKPESFWDNWSRLKKEYEQLGRPDGRSEVGTWHRRLRADAVGGGAKAGERSLAGNDAHLASRLLGRDTGYAVGSC